MDFLNNLIKNGVPKILLNIVDEIVYFVVTKIIGSYLKWQ